MLAQEPLWLPLLFNLSNRSELYECKFFPQHAWVSENVSKIKYAWSHNIFFFTALLPQKPGRNILRAHRSCSVLLKNYSWSCVHVEVYLCMNGILRRRMYRLRAKRHENQDRDFRVTPLTNTSLWTWLQRLCINNRRDSRCFKLSWNKSLPWTSVVGKI